MNEKKEGASPLGYHFLYSWHECRRKFLFEKVWGFTPTADALPLVLGKAFHKYKEVFYRWDNSPIALDVAIVEVSTAKLSDEDKAGATRRLIKSAVEWNAMFGALEFRKFEILGAEVPFSFPITDEGIEFTGKIDAAVVDTTDGLLKFIETKTTGKSVDTMLDATMASGQLDAYSLVAELLFPEHTFGGVIIEVVKSYDGKKEVTAECKRSPAVMRNKKDLHDFRIYATMTIAEIQSAVAGGDRGAFPPNYSACSGVRPCPFRATCRDLREGDPPSGFTKEGPAPGVCYLTGGTNGI